MDLISKGNLKALRLRYKEGTRVELISMDDPYTQLRQGDTGTVSCIDDTGTIFVDWDNGSSLGVVYGVDSIRVLASVVPDIVVEQILALRTLSGVPNMFDTYAIQRLAFEHGFYDLVNFIETDRKAYSTFIVTGK